MTQPARTSRTPSIPPSCPGNRLSPLDANTGAMGSLMEALKAINSESGCCECDDELATASSRSEPAAAAAPAA